MIKWVLIIVQNGVQLREWNIFIPGGTSYRPISDVRARLQTTQKFIQVNIASVQDRVQEQLIDLVDDSSGRDLLGELLVRLWCRMAESYPQVTEAAPCNLLLFPSPYLYEAVLSYLYETVSSSMSSNRRCDPGGRWRVSVAVPWPGRHKGCRFAGQ